MIFLCGVFLDIFKIITQESKAVNGCLDQNITCDIGDVTWLGFKMD